MDKTGRRGVCKAALISRYLRRARSPMCLYGGLARDLGRDYGLANATELTQKGRLDGSCMNLVYCWVSRVLS